MVTDPQRELGDRARVVGAGFGDAGRNHVRIANRLDLLECELTDESVEDREQLIEQADELGGRHRLGHRREVDDIGEQHRSRRHVVRDRPGFVLEPSGDRVRKDGVE